ncbi:MAG: replicative DNA helicase [Endomicrobiaceae bacterium]|nr:replicative DNA helicase [Endomicrobiaceae bacterium]
MSTNVLEKLPPQSLDAEMALIGAMLIEEDAAVKAIELVKEEDFYGKVHQLIFDTIRKLVDVQNQNVDIVTVNDKLKTNPLYVDMGGIRYLTSLIDKVKTAANVEDYANIIKDKSILRQIVNAGTKMVTEAYSEKKLPVDILDDSQEIIFNISKQNILTDFVLPSALIDQTVTKLEKLHNDKKDVSGLRTGFDNLDKMTSGFQPSELIILAGRPSMGKTSFALNIAENIAVHNKGTVAIYSLEMSKEALMMRFLASCALVNGLALKNGKFKAEDWTNLTTAARKLSESSVYILDKANMNVTELRASARKLAKQLEIKGKKLDLIIVDYLQLMRSNSGYKSESQEAEIADISRSLKGVARDLAIPVLALSQLSRENEKRGKDKTPQLSDLRGSGAIEQDADVVAFVHREGYYDREDIDKAKQASIIIAKQRNGPTGIVELTFETEYTKFFNKAYSSEEYQ